MTKEEAIALYETEFWKQQTPHQIAEFQLFEPLLCVPFSVFHGALETALGRSVWTHEMANMKALQSEFLGDRKAPTFAEILELIPAEKRIVVQASGGSGK